LENFGNGLDEAMTIPFSTFNSHQLLFDHRDIQLDALHLPSVFIPGLCHRGPGTPCTLHLAVTAHIAPKQWQEDGLWFGGVESTP